MNEEGFTIVALIRSYLATFYKTFEKCPTGKTYI